MNEENLQQTDNNAENTPAPEQQDFDSEARAQGWVSQEEFRGNEKDWVDAETFVKRGREILPIVRKNNEKLLKELKEARAIAEEARSTAKEFQKFQQEQYERKAKELEAELNSLKQAKREAINQGDGDRVVEIDDASERLREDLQEARQAAKAVPQPEAATNQPDPNLTEWLSHNEWFGQDLRTTGIANGLAEAIRKENPGLQGKAFLDKLDEELEATLPAKFGKKKVANPMDGGIPTGTSGRPSKSKRSYDSLPGDAKAACDRFVKQGLMTKEQYIESYDWSE
jgi:DNA repair exonuclease SbcCD ATPase subunit